MEWGSIVVLVLAALVAAIYILLASLSIKDEHRDRKSEGQHGPSSRKGNHHEG